MAEFTPSPAQQRAIDVTGQSVLVSAAAGSGKTWVLTQRLMRYIRAGSADIDSFVIITFTRAAAAELKSRISDTLTAEGYFKQSALVRRAPIGTIHSFCTSILRRYAHEAGLAPDFKVVADERADTMKLSAAEKALDSFYTDMDAHPGFRELVDTMGSGRDDRRLRSLVLNIGRKMQSHARPVLWAEEQLQALERDYPSLLSTPWGAELAGEAMESLRWCEDMLWDLLCALGAQHPPQERPYPLLYKQYADNLNTIYDAISDIERRLRGETDASDPWDAARLILNELSFPNFSASKKATEECPELKQLIMDTKNAVKKRLDKLKSFFEGDSPTILGELKAVAPSMRALIDLTLEYVRVYTTDKRDNSLVDYADLEHLAAELLTHPDGTPTDIARELSRQYTEILVDEYQDVSRVQELIFGAVSKNGSNLFMVGDAKQSIYRFRLADPGIILSKQRLYGAAAADGSSQGELVLLNTNYRSRSEVLDCVNHVFSSCMSLRLGELDYDESARLNLGASYPDSVPPAELLLLDMGSEETEGADSEDFEQEPPEKTALEAAMVAGRILALVDGRETVYDKKLKHSRPMGFGDIAILLRAANNVGKVYRAELIKLGIPVICEAGSSFFETLEVSAVVSMLELIDNPGRDIPLISVLSSPFFAFSPDELAEIRTASKEGDFYTRLCLSAREGNKRAVDFLNTLASLRSLAPDLSAPELVESVLSALDATALVSAMSDGEQRRLNLLRLTELAIAFESDGYHGLHRFVRYLARLRDRNDSLPSSVPDSSAVRILSIHKAKGLEFPVVFLSDTARCFNTSDSRAAVLVHPQLGLGPKFTDLNRRVSYPTISRRAIASRFKRETYSEEMRLMYVALTRAEERLFITGAAKAEKLLKPYETGIFQKPDPEELLAMDCPLKWFLAAYHAGGQRCMNLTVLPICRRERTEPPPPLEIPVDEESYAELCRNLAFSYSHPEAVSLPSKLTATELKRYAEPDSETEFSSEQQMLPFRLSPFRGPDFARDKKKPGAVERGIATHLALQYLDIAAIRGGRSVADELRRLEEQRFLDSRQADCADADAIEKLLFSPLGERIAAADELHREFRFSLLISARSLGIAESGEEILLQGVVDLCIREGDCLSVVDYKTDMVLSDEEIDARAEYYSPQLKAYSLALQRIFALPVKECVLYFLTLGKERRLGVD